MNSHRQSAMTAALQSQFSRRQLMAGIGVALPVGIGATHLVRPSAVSAQSMETNSVVIGMHEDIEFLNVLYTQGGNSLSSSKLAQRGLLFTDAEANWVGELATERNAPVSADASKARVNCNRFIRGVPSSVVYRCSGPKRRARRSGTVTA